MNPSSAAANQYAKALFDCFRKYAVALRLRVTYTVAGGQPQEEEYVHLSGFLLQCADRRVIATAGHCLRNLEDGVREGHFQVEEAWIVDLAGEERCARSTKFPLLDMPRSPVFSPEDGLDFGFVYPTDEYERRLWWEGMEAFSEANWSSQSHVRFIAFYLMGIPKHGSGPDGVYPRLISVVPIQDNADIPAAARKQSMKFPWLFARLNPKCDFDIKGMSGGPVLGVAKNPRTGRLLVWPLALQSSWHTKERNPEQDADIIQACPISVFGDIWMTAVRRLNPGLFSEEGALP